MSSTRDWNQSRQLQLLNPVIMLHMELLKIKVFFSVFELLFTCLLKLVFLIGGGGCGFVCGILLGWVGVFFFFFPSGLDILFLPMFSGIY